MLFEKDIPADRFIHIMEMARKLSESDWQILLEFINGMNVEQIAKFHGITRQWVYKRFNKIKDLSQIAIV